MAKFRDELWSCLVDWAHDFKAERKKYFQVVHGTTFYPPCLKMLSWRLTGYNSFLLMMLW
jgi:hypothetical protein